MYDACGIIIVIIFMWKNIEIVFGYLNLDLDLNLNFKVMDLKCLNFKSKNIETCLMDF